MLSEKEKKPSGKVFVCILGHHKKNTSFEIFSAAFKTNPVKTSPPDVEIGKL